MDEPCNSQTLQSSSFAIIKSHDPGVSGSKNFAINISHELGISWSQEFWFWNLLIPRRKRKKSTPDACKGTEVLLLESVCGNTPPLSGPEEDDCLLKTLHCTCCTSRNGYSAQSSKSQHAALLVHMGKIRKTMSMQKWCENCMSGTQYQSSINL
jgi:hypothetical protein